MSAGEMAPWRWISASSDSNALPTSASWQAQRSLAPYYQFGAGAGTAEPSVTFPTGIGIAPQLGERLIHLSADF